MGSSLSLSSWLGGLPLILPVLLPLCFLNVDPGLELPPSCYPLSPVSTLVSGHKVEGPSSKGQRGRGEGVSYFLSKPYSPQVIDTVPLGEVADDIFGYFEPLYRLIPDMPRPPETFLRRVTGQTPRMGALKVLSELS